MIPWSCATRAIFLAVAEVGSFSRAADRLGISQPTLSQQMRDLEAALRVSLFQRRGKRILLTSAGLIFQEHARAILRQFESFLQELSSRAATTARGFASWSGSDPERAVGYRISSACLLPNTEASASSLMRFPSTEIETALEEGRMDVGLDSSRDTHRILRYERLCTDEFALVVSEEHAWSQRRKIPFRRNCISNVATVNGQLRHAAYDGRDLSKASGPAADRCRNQLD